MKRVVAMMSGTSMDGIDVALLETDGERVGGFGPHSSFGYGQAERALLLAAKADARGVAASGERRGAMAEAETLVNRLHADAVRAFLRDHDIDADSIDLVGFHGQTVFHAPERGITVQLGDGAALARELGLPVAWDFRSADVAAGGQGAPLAPVWHRALAAHAGLDEPLVALNLGGVANVTFIAPGHELAAFDTGPANALIDDLVSARAGLKLDEGGRLAAAGRVDEAALARLMDNPYFAAPYPKSLDRDVFDMDAVAVLPLEDAAATLAAFTAHSVAAGIGLLPARPLRIVASGGGARNPVMLSMIGEATGAEVVTADALGWSAAAMEAQAFAYMAARVAKGLPITFPMTTGVREAMTGGRISRP